MTMISQVTFRRDHYARLMDMLDTFDPQWTFFQRTARTWPDAARQARIRAVNNRFTEISTIENLDSMKSTLSFRTNDQTAMMLRLSWPEIEVYPQPDDACEESA